jgi:hypothetical protein
MSSQIAAELVGANPGPAAHLALLGGIVVIGLVIFALTRRRKRREGQAEDELPTNDRFAANEPRTEATPRAHEQDPPTGTTGEAFHDEHKGGTP